MKDDKAENIFDKYHKEYDAWYIKNGFAYLSELEAVKKVLPKEGKGLEVGVGTGRFASVLGIKYGIDPSEKMLKIAKQRGVKVKLADGENLPFEDAVFDYAIAIISLCFTQDPQKVLKEANRVLREGGRIVIGIIDRDSFLGKSYLKKKSIFYEHAKLFSIKELARLLKKSGFGKFSYYQTIFSSLDKIDSIEVPQLGFGKGSFVVVSGDKAISI